MGKGVLSPIRAFVDLVERNQKKNMVVCEIGVFDGSTTMFYAPIVKKNEGKIIVIDWFKGNENVIGGFHGFDESKKDDTLSKFKSNLLEFLDIIEIKDGNSQEMIPTLEDNSVDICFIDADHRYINVKKDIELSVPKIKKDGILSGHDFGDINLANNFPKEWLEFEYINGHHYGVIQAVYESFGRNVYSLPDPNGQLVPIWVKKF